MPIKIYADANALIRGVEGDDVAAILVRRILAAEEVLIVSSELTLAEVLVGPLKQRQRDPADRLARVWRANYEALFTEKDALEAVPVSIALLRVAAALRAEDQALRLPDAIHLATAIERSCEFMLTNDKDLGRASGKRMTSLSLSEADLGALLSRIDASA